jgi:thiamine-monophosphate kinase
LSAWFPPGPATLVGIGDDAAVLAVPDGRVVATTDFLIEGRHFRRDWASAADVGHKAAARSLADCAAMGAEPSALLVALAAPPDLPVSWARELAEGLAAECARAGAHVIGGDTARADQVVLAVTGLGDLGRAQPGAPLRGRARRPGRGGGPARPRRGRPGPAGGGHGQRSPGAGAPAARAAVRCRPGGGRPGRHRDDRLSATACSPTWATSRTPAGLCGSTWTAAALRPG